MAFVEMVRFNLSGLYQPRNDDYYCLLDLNIPIYDKSRSRYQLCHNACSSSGHTTYRSVSKCSVYRVQLDLNQFCSWPDILQPSLCSHENKWKTGVQHLHFWLYQVMVACTSSIPIYNDTLLLDFRIELCQMQTFDKQIIDRRNRDLSYRKCSW